MYGVETKQQVAAVLRSTKHTNTSGVAQPDLQGSSSIISTKYQLDRSGGKLNLPIGTVIKGRILFKTRKRVRKSAGNKTVPKRVYFYELGGPNGPKRKYKITYVQKPVWTWETIWVDKWVKADTTQASKPDQLLPPNTLSTRITQNDFWPQSNAVHLDIVPPGLSRSSSTTSFDGVMESPPLAGDTIPQSYSKGPTETSFGSLSGSQRTALEKEALGKLYTKVATEYPNYLTNIAEAKKSYSMLLDIVTEAIKLVWELKRLDIKRLRKEINGLTAKDISDQWLRYVYGVQPLLTDLAATRDVLKNEMREWRSYSTSATLKKTIVSKTYNAFRLIEETDVQTYNFTIRYGVIMLQDNHLKSVFAKGGFSTPLATAYEIIPFSFMLDWIYALGDYLRSESVFNVTPPKYIWKTEFRNQSRMLHCRYVGKETSGVKYSIRGNPFGYTKVLCETFRVIPPSLPQMPRPKSPTSDGLTWRRLINALAIFIQKTS